MTFAISSSSSDIDKTEQIVEIMDLLGSILKSMDKPPSVNEKQKALMKSQLSPNLKIYKKKKKKQTISSKEFNNFVKLCELISIMQNSKRNIRNVRGPRRKS